MKNRFIFLCPLFLAFHAGAQTPDFEASLKQYSSNYEQERVHIHFDKDAYVPGETVWIKSYILAGSKPSALSKNIYFDWTDENGTVMLRTVAPVTDGSASGSFVIPTGFTGASVHLRVYTRWMLNFDEHFLFNRDIPVLTALNGAGLDPEKQESGLRFFPEGGELVDGIPSIVAFEALDQHGRPVRIKGVVQTAGNKVVDSFETLHDGMGSFLLRPVSGESYTAAWKDDSGRQHLTELPKRRTMGAVLRVTGARDNKISFQVERPSEAPDNLRTFTVIGTTHQQVVYRASIDLKNRTLEDGTIYAMQASGAVMQLTLMDATMSPVAERVVFVNNYKPFFETQVRNDLVDLGRRGRNEVSVEVPDSLGGDLSVSVTDGAMGTDLDNTIISDFLLSSELRGHVINPAWYFSNPSDSAQHFLDLVMLTHGWRRFQWENVVSGNLPPLRFAPDSDYIILQGKIAPAFNRFEPADSISLLLINKERKKWVVALPLQPDGSFRKGGLFFYDSLQVVYTINHTSRLAPGAGVEMETSLNPAMTGTVKANIPDYQWTRVPDVILEKESNGSITETCNYGKQPAPLNYVFTPVKNDSVKNNHETAYKYLQDNFPGMRFPTLPKEDHPDATENKFAAYSGTANQPVGKNNVNLLLDGNPVTLDDLKQVNMKQVLFIKFMQKTNAHDVPALSITTRQSLVEENIMNNKTGFAVLRGYTGIREFYVAPSGSLAPDQAISDFRSTLYWNPHLVLDRNHRKATISFYNNDVSNKFRIVIEGVNRQGKLTRLEEIIK
jgi:hypothetical protein